MVSVLRRRELAENTYFLQDDIDGKIPASLMPKTNAFMYFGHGATVCQDGKPVLRKVPNNCVLMFRAVCGDYSFGTYQTVQIQIEALLELNVDAILKNRSFDIPSYKRIQFPQFYGKDELLYQDRLHKMTFHVLYPGDTYTDTEFYPFDSNEYSDFASKSKRILETGDYKLYPSGVYERKDLRSVSEKFYSVLDVNRLALSYLVAYGLDPGNNRKHIRIIIEDIIARMYERAAWPKQSDVLRKLRPFIREQEMMFQEDFARIAEKDLTKPLRDVSVIAIREMIYQLLYFLQRKVFNVTVSKLMHLHPGVHFFGPCRSSSGVVQERKECQERLSERARLISPEHSPEYL